MRYYGRYTVNKFWRTNEFVLQLNAPQGNGQSRHASGKNKTENFTTLNDVKCVRKSKRRWRQVYFCANALRSETKNFSDVHGKREESEKKFPTLPEKKRKNWEKKFFPIHLETKQRRNISASRRKCFEFEAQSTNGRGVFFVCHPDVIPRLMSNTAFAPQWLIGSHGHLGVHYTSVRKAALFSLFFIFQL